MNKVLSLIKKSDKFFLIPLSVSGLSLLFILLPYLMFYNHFPTQLPLFYSLPWGSSQLVSKQQFLILPTSIILISLINSLLAYQLHPVQQTLKRVLNFGVIFIDLIVLITALKILFIFV